MTTTTAARTGRPRTGATPRSAPEAHPDPDRPASIPTLGQAPTEAEIRDAIARHVQRYGFGITCDDFYHPFDALSPREPASPWTDLRPTEHARLDEILEAAEARADERCRAVILEEAVAAGLAFAAECPDAPRAVR